MYKLDVGVSIRENGDHDKEFVGYTHSSEHENYAKIIKQLGTSLNVVRIALEFAPIQSNKGDFVELHTATLDEYVKNLFIYLERKDVLSVYETLKEFQDFIEGSK